MNTLKLLIRNLSNALFPTSALDGILLQGFTPIGTKDLPKDLPEDCELYSKGKERILYNGRTDEVVGRYINPF